MEEVREARAKIALSLAACFDVEHKGTIGLNEYSRGCRQIGLPDEDGAIWCRLATQFGDGASQAPDTAEVELDRLPAAAIKPVVDPSITAHVIKGLVASLCSLSATVEELQSEKVLERVAELEKQNAEQALEIGRLRHLESRRADRTKASALLAIWRGGIQPSFDAWARLVEEVRAQRREAARRALRPGLLRCFVRWKQQTAVEMNGAFMKGLVLQMMPSLRKYEVQRCLQLWIAGVERIHHQASVEQRGLELLLLAYLQRWSVRVKALLSAPPRMADVEKPKALYPGGTAHSQKVKGPYGANPNHPATARIRTHPQEGPATGRGLCANARPTSPSPRAVATGWHQDLNIYGTALSHTDEQLIQAEQLRDSAKGKVEQLEARLALAEARAAILERRQVLRELPAPQVSSCFTAVDSTQSMVQFSVEEPKKQAAPWHPPAEAEPWHPPAAAAAHQQRPASARAPSAAAADVPYRPSSAGNSKLRPQPPTTAQPATVRPPKVTVSKVGLSATTPRSTSPTGNTHGTVPANAKEKMTYELVAPPQPHRNAPPLGPRVQVNLSQMHGLMSKKGSIGPRVNSNRPTTAPSMPFTTDPRGPEKSQAAESPRRAMEMGFGYGPGGMARESA